MKQQVRFKLLPVSLAISSALTSNYLYAAEDTSTEKDVEVIQVSGIKSSLTESMDIKKNAPSIQDSIVAEDIGKFPDQNVAESLQRISGVSISRNNGEGSKVTVRGMGPQFNEVKINDRTIATTDRGREFDFQAIPSELIAGADVIKASRANLTEGSIGAYVNIRTARPLDMKGLQGAATINVRHNDLSDSTDPLFSGFISNTFNDDTFGVLLGFSHQSLTNRIDAAGTTHWENFDASNTGKIPGPVALIDGTPVTEGTIWTPGRATYTLDTEERERTSANLTLQWQQSDNIKHTFDSMYSDLSRQATSSGMQVPLQHNGWTDVTLTDNFTVSQATKFNVPIDGLLQERGQDSETLAFGLNSQFYLDRWTIVTDLSYSKAEAQPRGNTLVTHLVNPNYDDSLAIDDPDYIDGQIKGLTAEDYIHLDNRADILNFDTSVEYGNPEAVRTHWNDIRSNQREDEVLQAKLDTVYDIDSGVMSSLEMGVSYTDREKSQDTYKISQGCFNSDLFVAPDAPETPEEQYILRNTQVPYNTCGQRWSLDPNLFTVNDGSYLSEESGQFPRDFLLVNDMNAYKQAIADIRQEPDWTNESLSEAESVANTEETLALYTQLNLVGEASSFSWSGNVGLRYVDTTTSSSGHGQIRTSITAVPDSTEGNFFEIEYSEPRVLTSEQDYSHVLPSLNLNFDFENGYFIKTAAAKVITRPAIEDVGVARNYPINVRSGSYVTRTGNPFLEPYEANQFDLSFEYYGDKGDSYSVGLFYKDLEQYISQQRQSIDTGVPLDDGSGQNLMQTVELKANRKGGVVQGIEVAGLHYFDYLPSFLSGFGIQANYTYTDSEDKNADSDIGNETGELDNVASAGGGLEGFSKNSYNVIGFYDMYGFQARLAYNWREAYLKHRSGPTVGSNGLPQHVDDYGQLDFSAAYDINDHFTVRAEAINITNANILEYADIRERVVLTQYSGTRYQVGVTARF